ncbi:hypothetical protein BDR07DRAFT_1280977, partial [Suillus spraguei]
HREVLRRNIQSITKPMHARLAPSYRGAVKPNSGLIYEETRDVLIILLKNVIRSS